MCTVASHQMHNWTSLLTTALLHQQSSTMIHTSFIPESTGPVDIIKLPKSVKHIASHLLDEPALTHVSVCCKQKLLAKAQHSTQHDAAQQSTTQHSMTKHRTLQCSTHGKLNFSSCRESLHRKAIWNIGFSSRISQLWPPKSDPSYNKMQISCTPVTAVRVSSVSDE